MLCNQPGNQATGTTTVWLDAPEPTKDRTTTTGTTTGTITGTTTGTITGTTTATATATATTTATPTKQQRPYYDTYDDDTFASFQNNMDTIVASKPHQWQEFFQSFGNKKTCLARFLTAREGNIDKAEEMITTTFEFRRQHDVSGCIRSTNLERLQTLQEIRNYWTATFFGLTNDGSPIQYHRVEYLRPAVLMKTPQDGGIGGEEQMRTFYLWWMETSLSLQRVGYEKEQRETQGEVTEEMKQGIEIFDLKGISWWRLSGALSGLKMFSRALSVGQDHYPENLRKAFVLNAPVVITVLWSVVFLVLSARTKAKISISYHGNREGLLVYMTEKTIDQMFASTLCYRHDLVDVVEKERSEKKKKRRELEGGKSMDEEIDTLKEEKARLLAEMDHLQKRVGSADVGVSVNDGKGTRDGGGGGGGGDNSDNSDSGKELAKSKSVIIEDAKVDAFGFKVLSI